MACVVTGAVNCEVIEKRDTGAMLDGLHRFFNEVCMPKICYPDKDDIQDRQGRPHRERGQTWKSLAAQPLGGKQFLKQLNMKSIQYQWVFYIIKEVQTHCCVFSVQTFTDRAPWGLISIANSVENMMTKIEITYNMWFQVWNCDYLPFVLDRPIWQVEEENVKEQDLVYFKITDSKLSEDWRLGKVEYMNTERDGKVGVSFRI